MPRSPKILVVDDELPITTLLDQFLGDKLGFEVKTAGDGVQALELLETQDFDLIIADILMPEMDGFDLFHRVSDLAPGTKFIFMSGQFHPNVAGPDRSGSMTFLQKPFQLKDVQEKIEQLLPDVGAKAAQWIRLFRRKPEQEVVKSPLPGINFLDLIRLIMMLKKTGTLAVWIGPAPCRIEFQNGEVISAQGFETYGREAFIVATTWPYCRHQWVTGLLSGAHNIKESTDALLKAAAQISSKGSESVKRMDELEYVSVPGKDVGPFHFGKLISTDDLGCIYNALIMPGEAAVLLRLYSDEINGSQQRQSELQTEFNYQSYIEHENLAATYESGFIGRRMYTLHERPAGAPLSLWIAESEPLGELQAAELVLLLYHLTKFFFEAGVVLAPLSPAQIYWHPERGFKVTCYRTSWEGVHETNLFYYLHHVENLVVSLMGGPDQIHRPFANLLSGVSLSGANRGFASEDEFFNDLATFLKRPRQSVKIQSARIKEALELK